MNTEYKSEDKGTDLIVACDSMRKGLLLKTLNRLYISFFSTEVANQWISFPRCF
jgi:hypothetical protein